MRDDVTPTIINEKIFEEDLEMDFFYPERKPLMAWCPIWCCWVAIGNYLDSVDVPEGLE